MSRTKQALKIVFGSVTNQIIIVFAGLILPPLIINNYGSSINGLVNSVKQILSYFSVATVGLGVAAQIVLYKPLFEKNDKKICKIMSELSQFFDKVSCFMMIFIGFMAFLLPILKNGELDFIIIFSIVIICGSGVLIEFKFLQKYKILLQADQKQYITSNVNSQGTLVNLALSYILIKLDASIIIVQLVATFAYVIRMLLMKRKINQLYPFLKISKIKVKNEIPNQKEAFLYKISEIILNYISMSLVTILFSFSNVSVYSVYNTIFSSIAMIVNIFSSGFSSSFGNLLIEDKDKLKDSYKEYSYIYRIMSIWIYTTASILIIPFVSIYIRNSDGINYIIPALGVLFSIGGFFRCIRIPSTTIIDAIGLFNKKNIFFNFFEVFLNLFLSIIFSLKFGLIGILIGNAIASIIRSLIFIYDNDKNVMDISFFKDFVVLVLNFILGIFLYILFNDIFVHNYLEWFFEAFKVSILNGILFFVLNFVLDYSSCVAFLNRIKRILIKRS